MEEYFSEEACLISPISKTTILLAPYYQHGNTNEDGEFTK